MKERRREEEGEIKILMVLSFSFSFALSASQRPSLFANLYILILCYGASYNMRTVESLMMDKMRLSVLNAHLVSLIV
jgi:hypothetical protein